MWMWATACAVAPQRASHLKEPVFNRFPQLYHLDNYDRCLSQPDGLYCIGRFHLTAGSNLRLYKDIQKYSAHPLHYNRSAIHRGYCVSSRCPSSERNTSWRFEQCVQERANTYGLRATLLSHRCDVRPVEEPLAPADRTFLWAVGLLLLMNCVGTLYDVITSGNGKRRLLLAWSLRVNWGRLTATHEDGDPRLTALAPVQGFRVFLFSIIMLGHSVGLTHKVFLYNPQALEKSSNHPLMIFRNGAALVQPFVVLSNTLFAYTLLLQSKKHAFGLSKLPLFILHRLARLMPVHMLVVGFGVTWWKYFGHGPQWPSLVGGEAEVCHRKFWLHALFLNNLVDKKDHCIMPTWFLAADFQLYLVSSIVMLTILQKKWRPIPVLSAMFLASCVINTIMAYYNEWVTPLYFWLPENLFVSCRNSASFTDSYLPPWGSLPSALLGLLLASVHFHIQETGYKLAQNKVFVLMFHLSIPLLTGWFFTGMLWYDYKSLAAKTAHVALERPVTALLSAICMLGFINGIHNIATRAMAQRGLQVLGRLSLSVLLLHWCVNMTIVATRQTLTEVTPLNVVSDFLSTWWWTYWLALPMTLMVEMPFTKMLSSLLS